MIIGIISDTHGRLSEEAFEALKDSDVILHAGDVGGLEIIESLRKIAPVYAVRGNTDRGRWTQNLPMTQLLELEDMKFYVLHDIGMLGMDPKSCGIDVVIYGHSHIPKEEKRKGILYFNPGSAGPKRFNHPVCVGKIEIIDGDLIVKHIDIE